jgi:alpha-L-fucosidase
MKATLSAMECDEYLTNLPGTNAEKKKNDKAILQLLIKSVSNNNCLLLTSCTTSKDV